MMNHAARLGGRLNVLIQVRSFNAVCRMVAAGVGIGMVPRSSVAVPQGDFLRREASPLAGRGAVDGLKTVEITDPWAPRDLLLCTRARAELSPAAALFLHLSEKGRAQALIVDA